MSISLLIGAHDTDSEKFCLGHFGLIAHFIYVSIVAMMTDKEIVAALGGAKKLSIDLGLDLDLVRKFNQRGIPWKHRAAVQKLAKTKRVKLPPEFLETRNTHCA